MKFKSRLDVKMHSATEVSERLKYFVENFPYGGIYSVYNE